MSLSDALSPINRGRASRLVRVSTSRADLSRHDRKRESHVLRDSRCCHYITPLLEFRPRFVPTFICAILSPLRRVLNFAMYLYRRPPKHQRKRKEDGLSRPLDIYHSPVSSFFCTASWTLMLYHRARSLPCSPLYIFSHSVSFTITTHSRCPALYQPSHEPEKSMG